MNKLIFGTMDISEGKYLSSIKHAGECGYEIIDTAWVYQNEKFVGEAFNEYNNTHEKKLKLQTKIWVTFFNDTYNQVKNQLKELQQDKIYSVLLHRPTLDFNETISAWNDLIKLQKEGIIEKIGVSNFDKDMLQILVEQTGVKPWCNQIELSVTNFRSDRVDYCKKQDIEVQCWSPNGKNSMVLNNDVVTTLANKYNVDNSAIAISYLTSQGLNVVIKSENKDHIYSNFAAQHVVLSNEDIQTLKNENVFENKFEETYAH